MTSLFLAPLLLAGCGEAIDAQESHAASRYAPHDAVEPDNSEKTDDQPEIELQAPVALD